MADEHECLHEHIEHLRKGLVTMVEGLSKQNEVLEEFATQVTGILARLDETVISMNASIEMLSIKVNDMNVKLNNLLLQPGGVR